METAHSDPTYAFRSIAASGAVVVTLVGVAPMALAAINPPPTRSSLRLSTVPPRNGLSCSRVPPA